MKMTLLALAFILCANHLHAALGDTETELVKHYGNVLGSFESQVPKFTTQEFEYGGYHISATIIDDQCHREVYTKLNKEAFSEGEMQLLLAASTLGSKWQQKDDNNTITIWVLDSKEGFAAYYKSQKTFILKTATMLAIEEAVIKAQQQQQAESQDPTKNRNIRP